MVHGAPLQLGAIDSLARPGGNVTGLSAMDAEIGGKRVQLLRELIPNLSRIAVLATTPTTSPFGPPFVEDLRLAATSAGLGFEPILIGGSSELRSAFAEMGKAGVQAVVVQAFFDPYRGTLIDLASKYRLRVHVWQPGGHGSRRLGLYGGQLARALRAGCVLC